MHFSPVKPSLHLQRKVFVVTLLQLPWRQTCGSHCPILSEQFFPSKRKVQLVGNLKKKKKELIYNYVLKLHLQFIFIIFKKLLLIKHFKFVNLLLNNY